MAMSSMQRAGAKFDAGIGRARLAGEIFQGSRRCPSRENLLLRQHDDPQAIAFPYSKLK
jgi:hypothetical protein